MKALRGRRFIAVAIATLAACGNAADNQQISIQTFAERAASVDTVAGTYAIVQGIAEFGDSILVVADPVGRKLWRVNLRNGQLGVLGIFGSGPGEIEHVGRLVRVHRDSVLLLPTIGDEPFHILSIHSGKAQTIRLNSNGARYGSAFFTAGDTIGNLYGAFSSRLRDVETGVSGSKWDADGTNETIPVLRFNRRLRMIDTLFTFKRGVKYVVSGQLKDGTLVPSMGLGPYGPYNSWAVGDDGTLVSADARSYEIVVRDRNGKKLREFDIPSRSVATGKEGWDAYVKAKTTGAIVSAKDVKPRSSEQFDMAVNNKPFKYVVPEMPARLPKLNFGENARAPFIEGRELWLPVHHSDPPVTQSWDIVASSTGQRRSRLSLPARQFLIEVTRQGAYVLATDEHDAQRVILYRRRR